MPEEVLMTIRGIIFDINGTLIDIHTNEGHDDIYRVMSNLMDYQGVSLSACAIRDLYFQIMRDQRRESKEEHPEFDAVGIFDEILKRHASDFTRVLPTKKTDLLPLFLAEAFRAVSRFRLEPYPGVEHVLKQLRGHYLLAAVSDGQSAWAVPELHAVGLLHYFEPIIVSGDLGYRKPNKGIFEAALTEMKLVPPEVLFVGNDMYRDVFGAQQMGMKTVFFKSNQGDQEKEGVEPDYIIYNFSELPRAIRFFEKQ
jgi:putative hydrolase of the HAD superfamily